MTYAEKADIAAKAVKVLDSVAMSRHETSATKYARMAAYALVDKNPRPPVGRKYFDDGSGIGFFVLPVGAAVIDGFERMKRRLDKPRYRLVGGEWVRAKATHKEKEIVEHVVKCNQERNAAAFQRGLQSSMQGSNMGIGQAIFGPQPY